MIPRYAADYRTILWVLIPPVLIGLQYFSPDWLPYLSWLSCYFALACGVIAHNHNHSPTFLSKRANRWFGYWLSIFYGYPCFAWIPTHNLNHHKFVNRPGDATITWRYTNKHNALVAATYFFVSSWFQSTPIKEYIASARAKRPELYRSILANYTIWLGSHMAMLCFGIWLHGWKVGFMLWCFTMLLPAVFALWTIMLFNYDQHVHTDAWSEWNHSRNFVGKLLNFLLFNNGYHTAHHLQAGLHWSKLPEAHARVEHHIHPQLKQRSVWWYWLKQYLLALLIPSLGTRQLGRPPYEDHQGERLDLATAQVGLGETGTNVNIAG